jgi:type I restriction enzyme S subunit
LLYGRGRAVPPLVQVGELARQRPTDVDVSPDEEYHFAGVYSFGRGVFPGEKKKGAEFAYKELTRLRRGDFTYPKLMAWEGALGIVPTECDGLVVSPEFPVFELDDDRVLPDVLDVYFRDPMIWPSLKGDSPGTNVRRRRLNPSTFLGLKIPLPSMGDQRRLAGVRAQLTDAARARADSLDELDDLVGCMLWRVFGDAQDQPAPTEDRTAA